MQVICERSSGKIPDLLKALTRRDGCITSSQVDLNTAQKVFFGYVSVWVLLTVVSHMFVPETNICWLNQMSCILQKSKDVDVVFLSKLKGIKVNMRLVTIDQQNDRSSWRKLRDEMIREPHEECWGIRITFLRH